MSQDNTNSVVKTEERLSREARYASGHGDSGHNTLTSCIIKRCREFFARVIFAKLATSLNLLKLHTAKIRHCNKSQLTDSP